MSSAGYETVNEEHLNHQLHSFYIKIIIIITIIILQTITVLLYMTPEPKSPQNLQVLTLCYIWCCNAIKEKKEDRKNYSSYNAVHTNYLDSTTSIIKDIQLFPFLRKPLYPKQDSTTSSWQLQHFTNLIKVQVDITHAYENYRIGLQVSIHKDVRRIALFSLMDNRRSRGMIPLAIKCNLMNSGTAEGQVCAFRFWQFIKRGLVGTHAPLISISNSACCCQK